MIFVDTGAFFALKVKNHPNHVAAVKTSKQIQKQTYGKMVTTNYIIDELITLLCKKLPHSEIIQYVGTIRNSPNILIVWIDEEMEHAAWEYFKKHQDKFYSFTDCTSFMTMKVLNIDSVFTFDMHFSQANFQVTPPRT